MRMPITYGIMGSYKHDTRRHTMGFSGYFALLVIIAALLGDFD